MRAIKILLSVCRSHFVHRIQLKQPSRFEGEWVADKKQGIGYCEFPNGSIYEGQYRNDVQVLSVLFC